MKQSHKLAYRRIQIDLDPADHQRLKALADEAERSVGRQVKIILKEYLDTQIKTKPAKKAS